MKKCNHCNREFPIRFTRTFILKPEQRVTLCVICFVAIIDEVFGTSPNETHIDALVLDTKAYQEQV